MAAKNGDTYPIGSTFSEESAMAWVAQAKAAREEASKRTLAEHEAHLRQYGTGDADYLSKHSYMEEHGLKYVNGMLVRDRWVRSLAGGAEGQARISAPIGGTDHCRDGCAD